LLHTFITKLVPAAYKFINWLLMLTYKFVSWLLETMTFIARLVSICIQASITQVFFFMNSVYCKAHRKFWNFIDTNAAVFRTCLYTFVMIITVMLLLGVAYLVLMTFWDNIFSGGSWNHMAMVTNTMENFKWTDGSDLVDFDYLQKQLFKAYPKDEPQFQLLNQFDRVNANAISIYRKLAKVFHPDKLQPHLTWEQKELCKRIIGLLNKYKP
jgi:hypothetical protein